MHFTIDQAHKIADKEIEIFSARIARADRDGSVRKDECEWYLKIWKSIRSKAGVSEFTWEEHNEMADAIDSGEYEEILKGSGR